LQITPAKGKQGGLLPLANKKQENFSRKKCMTKRSRIHIHCKNHKTIFFLKEEHLKNGKTRCGLYLSNPSRDPVPNSST